MLAQLCLNRRAAMNRRCPHSKRRWPPLPPVPQQSHRLRLTDDDPGGVLGADVVVAEARGRLALVAQPASRGFSAP